MKKILTVVAAAFLIAACAPKTAQRLVILHVNDTHSHLEPERSGALAGHGGAVERAAIVDSVRKAAGAENVLLLHAGDFSQGTSYFTVLEGAVENKIVNALGYDCVTLGNHEFDNGIEALCERLKLMDCEVVCANLDLSPFELGEYVKPCTVVEKAGRKIGIIGLEADISTNVSKTISSRIPQLDNVEVTNKWSEYLRGQDCDLVILLSHIGYREDQALVPQTHGLDLVIGGHSHTKVDGFLEVADADGRQVPIITDWCWGYEVGEISVY